MMQHLQTEKPFRAIEAALEMILKLIGLLVVFLAFDFIAQWLLNENFNSDTLLSLVILPAIYVLKECDTIIKPFTIKVHLSETLVKVESGLLTQKTDSLNLRNIENIEVISTLIGRWKNYSTLYLYAYGSWVQLPYIKNAEEIKSTIEKIIENQSNSNT